MQRMTAAEATVETLVQHGVDKVYGVPGVHNDSLFDALHGAKDRIRMIHARHEQTGAYMALGASMVTGRPQVCTAVPGPGVLNTTAALATAWATDAPVVLLAGQIPSAMINRGFGHLHEISDQIGLLGHLTKHTARITGPHDASSQVANALSIAMSGRRRPVALECSIDVWGRTGPAPIFAAVPAVKPPVDPDAIGRAARVLGAARRPLIVVGGGASDAGAEVAAVAELLGAPVMSYRRGRGVISTEHELAVNFPIGYRLWETADAVLAIGTRLYLQQAGWGLDDRLPVVRLDIDPEEPDRYRPPAVSILADAAAGLRALIAALPGSMGPHEDRTEELGRHRAWLDERLTRLEPQMGFIRAMRAALPDDGILVDEVTQLGFAARMAFPVRHPRSFISTHQDNLGYGFGTALGAKAACPDRAVLAIAGDGGFGYQGMELATAVLHNLAVVVVVFDDGAFGNVRRIQQTAYGNRLIADKLHNPDFFKFAESFGVAAYRARTPDELEARLREAFALNAPALVHVKVEAMPSIWDLVVMPGVRGDRLGHGPLPP